MVVGNFLMSRRTGRQSHSSSVAEYEEKKARIEGDAAQALAAERTARRRGFPDPAEVVLTAVGPGAACGSAAPRTPTSWNCASAPPTCPPTWSCTTRRRTSTAARTRGPRTTSR
ncbi:hypothetical protein PQR15_18495 [Streptomyces lydicus]|nr:hypothetical protein [Streptomyces lydicus]